MAPGSKGRKAACELVPNPDTKAMQRSSLVFRFETVEMKNPNSLLCVSMERDNCQQDSPQPLNSASRDGVALHGTKQNTNSNTAQIKIPT